MAHDAEPMQSPVEEALDAMALTREVFDGIVAQLPAEV